MHNYDELYEAALKPQAGWIKRTVSTIWLVAGLSGLIVFAWAEPWSQRMLEQMLTLGVPPGLVNYMVLPVVMAMRAVILVESFGYGYHRFFQHVGFFTRTAQLFRRNQRFHWIHHMLIYPIGRLYRRDRKYIAAEPDGLSWVMPGVIAGGLFAWTHGVNLGTLAFIASIAAYAWLVIDNTHGRFHEESHSWAGSRYFQWLEQIHLLHHWDQRYNFTIIHPLMDMLFGTYLDPRKHPEEMRIALEDRELTASDIINWRYLLIEATPTERAEYISNARHHRSSRDKVELLLKVLQNRIASHPDDVEAIHLLNKAVAFREACRQPRAKK